MPPLRSVRSCSPSASARTVTAHSLKAIGIEVKGETVGLSGVLRAQPLRCNGSVRTQGILCEIPEIAKPTCKVAYFIPPQSGLNLRLCISPSGGRERIPRPWLWWLQPVLRMVRQSGAVSCPGYRPAHASGGRPEAAASGRFEPQRLAVRQLAAGLGRKLLAVEQVAPGRTRRPALGPGRRVTAAFG